MSVSLTKGQSVSLTKEAGDAGLKKIFVGLGWDAAEDGKEIDLDASVVLLNENGTVEAESEFVFYNQTRNANGSVEHTGDNLTGAGDGDDETINIDLTTLPEAVKTIQVIIHSFSGQKFTEVKNLVARVVNSEGDVELAKFESADLGDVTGNRIATITRNGSDWEFAAIGEQVADFVGLVKGYGVNIG